MSNAVKERRKSLEEKAKTLEEKARLERLAIDKKLAVQILEEENLTHDAAVKELEEENRMHNAAVKELEDKIANLEQQMQPLPSAESPPPPTTSEPAEEISDDVDEGVSADVLSTPEESVVDRVIEGSKKKKRSFY
jgi:phage shock protein A